MLDTVILEFPDGQYAVNQPEWFSPSLATLAHTRGYAKCVHNLSASKSESTYYPRLTVYKRTNQRGSVIVPLRIEFSAPKLLYGNNIDELAEGDLPKLEITLAQRLSKMGVIVTPEAVAAAEVQSFHVCKNIPLTGGYTATLAIKELYKVNLTKHLDLTKVDFRNEGHALQLYSNSHSLVFYDKLADLLKPRGRAVDKDQAALPLQEIPKGLELLRIEIRLSKKAKVKEVMQKFGNTESLTLADICKKQVCKDIMADYWTRYIGGNMFLFNPVITPITVLKQVWQNQAAISPKQAIYLAGLYLLGKDEGVRQLRQVVEQNSSRRTWQRMSLDIKQLNTATGGTSYGFLKDIRSALAEFEPYRLGRLAQD